MFPRLGLLYGGVQIPSGTMAADGRQCRGPITPFTLDFPNDPSCDETAYAAAVGPRMTAPTMFGCAHAPAMSWIWSNAARYLKQPFGDSSAMPSDR